VSPLDEELAGKRPVKVKKKDKSTQAQIKNPAPQSGAGFS
jgi:hypothetical protein